MTFTDKRFGPWLAGITIASLLSAYFFFQDLINPNWSAWVIAPLVVLGFFGAVRVTAPDGLARLALYNAALVLVPFMALYSIVEELFKSDWQQLIVVPIVVFGLWLTLVLNAEEDDA